MAVVSSVFLGKPPTCLSCPGCLKNVTSQVGMLSDSKTCLRSPLGKGCKVTGKEAWKLQAKAYVSEVTLLGVLQSEFMEAREMMDICL